MKQHPLYGIGGIALGLMNAGYLSNGYTNISAVAAVSDALPDVAEKCHAEAVLQLFKSFGIGLVHQTQQDLSCTVRQLNLANSETRDAKELDQRLHLMARLLGFELNSDPFAYGYTEDCPTESDIYAELCQFIRTLIEDGHKIYQATF